MSTPLHLVLVATLLIALTPIARAQPANDQCSSATPVTGGIIEFDLTEATVSVEGQKIPQCEPSKITGISNDVWFCWTAGCSGVASISTCGLTDVNTKIAIYSGCSCGSLTLLCCNDDFCGLQSCVQCTVDAGSQYLIQLGAIPESPPGPGSLSIACGDPGCCPQNDQCPPGSIIEDEQCGSSTNGGCNDPPLEPVHRLECDDVICGTFWWDGTTSDSDWYEFQISSARLVSWSVFADVPVDTFILAPGCAAKVLATGTGDCPSTATAVCLPAGTYRAYVGPAFTSPLVACFSPQSNYVAKLTCETCPPASGCCEEDRSTFIDPICAAQMCQIYPFCCDGECDEVCEQLAAAICGLCEHCTPPPPDMISWWTFDEVPASSTATDVAGGHDGVLVGSPVSVPGKSNSALQFNGANQHVVVTSPGTYDFGEEPFSIDAWIKWDGTHQGTIFSNTNKDYPHWFFSWYVSEKGGLGIALQDCARTCSESVGGAIAPNFWTHVTLVASGCTCKSDCCNDGGDPARVFKLYSCGALVHAYTAPSGSFCVISDGGPILIGWEIWGCGGHFPGIIDEVEVFNRELLVSEIEAICQADSDGKCKQRCHANWNDPYCLNTDTLTTTAWVCNESSAPESYLIQFQGTSSVLGQTCNGPLLNASNFSFTPNQVTVPPGECLAIPVEITRPAGLAPGESSCYTLTATNLQTSQACQCHGSVTRTNKWCWKKPIENCCIMPCCNPISAVFDVENTDDVDESFTYSMSVMGPDMKPDAQYVRLNGLPPGTPVTGTIALPVGESTTVPVQIEFTEHVPFQFFDLLISGDENDDGDDSEVVVSVGLHSEPTPTPPPPPLCPADIAPLGGNGLVDVDDLLAIINSWGDCPTPPSFCIPDITYDGTVDIDDLLAVINGWGSCR